MWKQENINTLIIRIKEIQELISENTHLHFAYKIGTAPINKIGDRTTPVILKAYTDSIMIMSDLSIEEMKMMKMSSCDFISDQIFWADLIDSENKSIFREKLKNVREKIEKFISILESY